MDDTHLPREFAHVGLTVPDVDEAIEWYVDVLDWTLLKGPRSSTANEGYGGRRAVDLLGDYATMRVAHLLSGNGVGIEFFEFEETARPAETDPRRPGFSHICVVDADVEGLATTIERRGGEHDADVWRLYEDSDEYRLTYCSDPWENVIEIYSHSHEEMHGNVAPTS